MLEFQYQDSEFVASSSGPALERLELEIRLSNISKALETVVRVGTETTITFKAALTGPESTTLDAIVASHSGVALSSEAETSTGVPIVTVRSSREGSTPTFVSPNWCKKTTWYDSSTRVTNEVLTDSGDQTTYNSAQTNWINLIDGELTQGHLMLATHGYNIRVNGNLQVVNTTGTTNGDYSVDAEAGTVTFNTPLTPSDVVDADYNYSVDSVWIIKPTAGKQLELRSVEVQFSADIVLTTASTFIVYGFVEAFAPHLLIENGGPLAPGTLIPIKDHRYYRMHNYIEEAQKAYSTIPAMGGGGFRGMTNDMQIFNWPYTDHEGDPIVLSSSKGMELRIALMGDIPFTGERATATIYARSVDKV